VSGRGTRGGARGGTTWVARLIVAAAVVVALLGRRRPGEMVRLPPAVVVGELRVAPFVVHARPAPDGSAPDGSAPGRSAPDERGPGRRLPLFTSLRERARAGERVPVQITAYCLRGLTRRGNETRAGIAAADPRFFPLSRHVEVFIGRRRVGRYLVDDTGGAIRGAKLDLWTESCADARRFGRRRGTAMLVMEE
jgi:3D (Asp-Asp-Asp) domain-containing protein